MPKDFFEVFELLSGMIHTTSSTALVLSDVIDEDWANEEVFSNLVG